MAIAISDYRFVWHRVGTQDANFEASDQDTSDPNYFYFGFLHSDGAYIIQRFDNTVPNQIAYRYATGQSGYSVAWAGRALLTYKLFNAATIL